MPVSKWNLVCVAAATMVCGSAMAAPQLAASSRAPAAQGQSAPSSLMFQGVQVAIDPRTGQLREPTAAERAALSKAMLHRQALEAVKPRQAGERPRTEAEANTTLKRSRTGQVGMLIQLPESQMNYLTAERAADGSVRIHHQGDAAAPAASQEVSQ